VKFLQFAWRKPVLTFYRERFGKPEREAVVVVQAMRLSIVKNDSDDKLRCTLEDFFPLMGDIDYISSNEGKADRYVLCWFDDRDDDFGKAFRRLTGVTFPEEPKCVTDEKSKRSYSVQFEAKHGKLE